MPAAESRRWWTWPRIALLGLLVLIGSCYAAVLIVRATKEIRPAPPMPYFDGKEVLVIAHRGASGQAPEHTLEAYDRAVEQGADVLELDVRLSRDGVAIVIHDETLERTLGVAGSVSEMSLAELRAAGGASEPPTLEQVMRRYPDRRLNVELKGDDPSLADAVAELVERLAREDSVLVASFDGDSLERFRARTGGRVATSASAGEVLRFYLCFLMEVPCGLDYQALQLPAGIDWLPDLSDRSFLRFARRHGLEVHFWTVDDEALARRLVGAGANGIMTNFPGRIARAIQPESSDR